MTLEEIIKELKAQNPTLRKGSEQQGYEQLNADEYEEIILDWANNKLAKLEKAKFEEESKNEGEAKRSAALAKLAALGLTADDLRALGL